MVKKKESLFFYKSTLISKYPLKKASNLFQKKIEPTLVFIIYMLAVMIIIYGIISSIIIFFQDIGNQEVATSKMRIELGEKLIVALTFILAAEVLRLFTVSNFYQLLKVGVLVLLRTLITYFLDLEIKFLKNNTE